MKDKQSDGCLEKPSTLEMFTSVAVHILMDMLGPLKLNPTYVSKDMDAIRNRSSQEGLSFFTKTLPALGKCLDKALATNCALPRDHGFKNRRGSNLPEFLGGLWDLVFCENGTVKDSTKLLCQNASCPARQYWSGCSDAEDAMKHECRTCKEENHVSDELRHTLIHEAQLMQVKAVRAIRQICYLAYKLEQPYEQSVVDSFLQKFVEVDVSLPAEADEVPLSRSTTVALDNAAVLLAYVLREYNPSEGVPCHGPGAVAHGEKPWDKKVARRYYPLLDKFWSYSEFMYASLGLAERARRHHLEKLPTLRYAIAKVQLVPKDSRGPRLISEEPMEVQYFQQAIRRSLYCHVEHGGTPVQGFVNFTDQSINQDWARRASIPSSSDSNFVTVDMKDASDRVSLWLVRKIFPKHVYDYLFAARSQATRLPNGTVVPLKKFAPMGSATCFPVEALCFWALAVGASCDMHTASAVRNAPRETPVYVYGDDLVLSRQAFANARPIFEELHLRFNEDKCCTSPFFRESCGVDAFFGSDVTPVKVRIPWDDGSCSQSPKWRLSWIAYTNAFQEKGYPLTAEMLRSRITLRIGQVPWINTEGANNYAFYDPNMSTVDVIRHLNRYFKVRFNKDLQLREWRVPTLEPLTIKSGRADGWELTRFLSNPASRDEWGVLEERPKPCHYTVPRQLKLGYAWKTLTGFSRVTVQCLP